MFIKVKGEVGSGKSSVGFYASNVWWGQAYNGDFNYLLRREGLSPEKVKERRAEIQVLYTLATGEAPLCGNGLEGHLNE